jgi:glutamate-5-semialdehyde dehydrogenase
MQAPLDSDAERTADALVRAARTAARALAGASSTRKDDALRRAADGLRRAERSVLDANQRDLERTRAAGEAAAFLDRLTLTPARIDAMATGLDQIPSARRSRRGAARTGSRSRRSAFRSAS